MFKAGGSSNGRTAAFEAVNWGSSPCPPAVNMKVPGDLNRSGLYWVGQYPFPESSLREIESLLH